jgi:hypothetical protein
MVVPFVMKGGSEGGVVKTLVQPRATLQNKGVLRDLTSDDQEWYGSAGRERPAGPVVPAPSGSDSPEP